MGVKQVRMARLFNAETGRSVCIPVDHGVGMGSVPGLTDPIGVLKELVDLGIDSTLMNKGLGQITQHLFERKDAPGRILTSDLALFSCTPGGVESPMEHELIASVEEALRGDYAAVKSLLIFGMDTHIEMKNLKHVADLAEACDRWNMPLMVEPVMWGEGIPKEKKLDPELIEHAARIALELGADILKMPYSGDVASFADLVRRFAVPVVVLGGPKMSSLRDVFQVAADSTRAGARGLVFGRNVWQSPHMAAIVRALQDIVHRNVEVDSVMTLPAFSVPAR